MADGRVEQLLDILSRAYNRRSWHGTNLRGSIRGLTANEAAARPAPGRHNIWELVVHAAYWKYAVWRRLTGASRGTFREKGSNWFERPGPGGATEEAWRKDIALLESMHTDLVAAVSALRDEDLTRRVSGSKVTLFELIAGIAAHDLYHAGQMQLVKRLTSSPGSQRRRTVH